MSLAARSDPTASPCTVCNGQPRDDLTGLLPRGAFMAAMAEALRRPGAGICLLLLDLDRFKAVNDSLGHPVGDALLRAAAARIGRAVRAGDVVGRLGGDEFAVLLAAPVDGRAARRLGARLVKQLSRPYLMGGQVAHIGVSIGAALVGPIGQDADGLLAQADLALYAAKAAGRGCAKLFGPAMRATTDAVLALRLDLREALERQEFTLFYQPLLNIAQNRIEGFEGLLRWHHPVRGLVAPRRFIPMAEQLGLMPAIGAWALRAGCAEAVRWPEGQRLALNVSASQFHDGRFPALVAQVLAETGLAPARLELELPEAALVLAGETALLRQMRALRGLGVGLALDDFGTGHASLTQLRGMPVQRLKIDPSLAGDTAMLRAVLGISGVMGFVTTAEGVETPAHLALLREHGCTEAQGRLISQPLPVAQLWTVSPPRVPRILQAA
ncbi:MAG: EAL domain-containing protein [Rubritepida sp.]|nr:EAL domain-containing protein [Rubritepida sp.]